MTSHSSTPKNEVAREILQWKTRPTESQTVAVRRESGETLCCRERNGT
ncbi:hypothetical protein HSB1_10390 [Halogranum salarium B-1]|uniref:Uncharacterized protein n=1 Tax=Halogranum salarium B-1 TaxID=1210908 RepID=J3JGV8_9EURY|nr:hypothetical protein HSB1_10390 [Halogranum salarium B-1]